jgi:hypothetical protein
LLIKDILNIHVENVRLTALFFKKGWGIVRPASGFEAGRVKLCELTRRMRMPDGNKVLILLNILLFLSG